MTFGRNRTSYPIFLLERQKRSKHRTFQNARVLLAIAFGLLLTSLVESGAEEPNGFKNSPEYQEIWKKSQSLRPQPSTDTTPIIVKMLSSTYRIPRNYLIFLGDIPTIKVAIPGLKPLTDENRECFGSILQGQQAGCASIEFHLAGSGLSPRQMLANRLRNISSQPKMGPYGYTVYEIGPENARTELYIKEDRGNLIKSDCTIFYPTGGNRAAVCTNWFVLDDGNTMHFFSHLDQLESLPEIENGMRQIMNNFRVKESLK